MLNPPHAPSHLAELAREAKRGALLLTRAADPYARSRLAAALFYVAAAAALTALAPIALKSLVDGLSSGRWTASPLEPVQLALAYVLALWLSRMCAELRGFAYGRAEQRIQRRINQLVFGHAVKLPFRYHVDGKTGAFGQILTNAQRGCELLLYHTVFSVAPVGIELLVVAIVLIHFNQAAFLCLLAFSSLLYTFAFASGVRRTTEPARAVSAAHVNARAVLTDSMLNYETVKQCNAESLVESRFACALAQAEARWDLFHRIRAANGFATASVFALSLAAAMAYAIYEVWRGSMSLGEFVLVNTYLLQLVRPLEMLGLAVRDVPQALANLEAAVSLLREERESAKWTGSARPSGKGELDFERVSFAYDPQRPVLVDLTFHVPAGKTVAVVGASGSGKSSLIRLLVGFYKPDRGRILFDRRPISDLALHELRRVVAVVPQDTILLNESVAENIRLGRCESTQEDIEHAARVANLHDFVMSLPEGYATIVGERGVKVSGGERQRIAIARAVLRRPHVFVFDEATASLDTRTERQILSNLIAVSAGHTTLVVAHRLSTVMHAHQILVLDQGAIIECGSHTQLMRLNGAYARMWRAQQSSAPSRALSAR